MNWFGKSKQLEARIAQPENQLAVDSHQLGQKDAAEHIDSTQEDRHGDIEMLNILISTH
jgi:hypothetical protein